MSHGKPAKRRAPRPTRHCHLAANLLKVGHTVTIAARDLQSDSVHKAQQANPALKALPTQEALRAAEVVFLATPYQANADALAGLNLASKVLFDCTNPVGPGLTHGLQNRTSGAEEVQRLAPGAKVVKAFTIYGFENFQNSACPSYGNLKPAMLIAGDDAAAKATVDDAALFHERPVTVLLAVFAAGMALEIHTALRLSGPRGWWEWGRSAPRRIGARKLRQMGRFSGFAPRKSPKPGWVAKVGLGDILPEK